MISVQHVPLQYVHQTWPLVEDYINSAIMLGDPGEALYNLDHIKQYVTSGQWEMFVAVDEHNKIHGAVTVVYNNYPLHRVAFATAIGGKLIVSKEAMLQFKELLKQRGVTLLQAYGRESIVRLWKRYNFESRNTLVELPL